MAKEQVSVVVDVHEPPEITGAVGNHPDVEEYSIDELPAADIEVEGVGFERKTVQDYALSLTSGRLEDQCRKLNDRYEHAYVLVDGDLVETDNPFKSNINGESLRGHMASLTAREDSGVEGVFPCSNPALLADMAVRLARKHIEESDRTFVPQPVDDPDVSTAFKMYCCMPDVGPTTAEKLEAEWSSAAQFVEEVDYDTLQQIDGIGEATALKIIDAMT